MRQEQIIETLLGEVRRRVEMAKLSGNVPGSGNLAGDYWLSAAALSLALGQALEQKARECGEGIR